ncbi:hypothetical protein TNIN_464171 [Trichonephila inaurata madagascariensis]|uniref:Uncharacterized protein n=1 Tax=Trichonephila inaurata madagascariensis TaxID=2747483 RepID=A0A8X6YGX6_9ARAC|nr:hypothetical protein TNIN_464171 [Trichonephila inaurata madagascariensis]
MWKKGYSRDDVYNVDETGVNWKALPRKSLASKRESTAPGFKVSKEYITAMLRSAVEHKVHRLEIVHVNVGGHREHLSLHGPGYD